MTDIGGTRLADFSDALASRDPAPAGVAAAAVAATLGASLLIKVLEIRKQSPGVVSEARALVAELREAADADCAAVRQSLRSQDAIAAPLRAARATVRAIELCGEAGPAITGLLAADLQVGKTLLRAAADAILLCLDANLQRVPSADAVAEVQALRARLGIKSS